MNGYIALAHTSFDVKQYLVNAKVTDGFLIGWCVGVPTRILSACDKIFRRSLFIDVAV